MSEPTIYVQQRVMWTRTPAQYALSRWNSCQQPIMPATEQPTPAWPKLRRLLERNGWQAGQPLTYRQLQAAVGWRQNLMLDANQPQGTSGGGAAAKAQPDATKPSPAKERAGRSASAQRQTSPVRLWHPWPQPNKQAIAQAATLLTLVQQELVESARASVPVSWRYGELAVRQEMGQLDPARHWARLGVPRLMLALDFSGSMGNYISKVAALGAVLATAFPWLVVAAAPNGDLEDLTRVEGKGVIVDGEWKPIPDAIYEREGVDRWRALDALYPVAGCIYVGDWEDWRMAEAFAGRFGVASVFQASVGPARRTDAHFGRKTAWPTVTRCNSVMDFLAAVRMLIPHVANLQQSA